MNGNPEVTGIGENRSMPMRGQAGIAAGAFLAAVAVSVALAQAP
jgi:hypothetical protein